LVQKTGTGFLKNTFTLLSGNIIAQGVLLVFSLILPRFYNPDQFGAFSILLVSTNIFVSFSALKYELCIVLAEKKEDSKNLYHFSLTLSLGFFIILLIFSPLIAWWSPVISFGFLLLILFSALLAGWNNVINYHFIKNSWYRSISLSRILFALSASVLQLGLFWIFPDKGLSIGYFGGLLILTAFLARRQYHSFQWQYKALEFNKLAKRFFPIIKFSLPSNLLNTLSSNIQPLIIVAAFSLKEAGLFFLAYKLLATPLNVITNSISQVYFREASEMVIQDKEKLLSLTRKVNLSVLAICIPAFLLTFFFSEWLFEFLFGSQWRRAGLFTIWLIPYFLGKSLVHPVSSLAEVLNKTKLEFTFNIFLFIIVLLSALAGYFSQSILVFIGSFSLAGGITYLILLFKFYRIIKTTKGTKAHREMM